VGRAEGDRRRRRVWFNRYRDWRGIGEAGEYHSALRKERVRGDGRSGRSGEVISNPFRSLQSGSRTAPANAKRGGGGFRPSTYRHGRRRPSTARCFEFGLPDSYGSSPPIPRFRPSRLTLAASCWTIGSLLVSSCWAAKHLQDVCFYPEMNDVCRFCGSREARFQRLVILVPMRPH